MAKRIYFSKNYKKKLLKGEKTSTIRLGIRKGYKVGDIVDIIVSGKPVMKARITAIEYVKLKELTEEDAKLDGFHKKSKLVKALKMHYPKIKETSNLTIIRFKPIKENETK